MSMRRPSAALRLWQRRRADPDEETAAVCRKRSEGLHACTFLSIQLSLCPRIKWTYFPHVGTMQPDSLNAGALVKTERGGELSSGEEEKHRFNTPALVCLHSFNRCFHVTSNISTDPHHATSKSTFMLNSWRFPRLFAPTVPRNEGRATGTRLYSSRGGKM